VSNDTVGVVGVYWLGNVLRSWNTSNVRSGCSGYGRAAGGNDRSNRSTNVDIVGLLIVLDWVEADVDLSRNAGCCRKDDSI